MKLLKVSAYYPFARIFWLHHKYTQYASVLFVLTRKLNLLAVHVQINKWIKKTDSPKPKGTGVSLGWHVQLVKGQFGVSGLSEEVLSGWGPYGYHIFRGTRHFLSGTQDVFSRPCVTPWPFVTAMRAADGEKRFISFDEGLVVNGDQQKLSSRSRPAETVW